MEANVEPETNLNINIETETLYNNNRMNIIEHITDFDTRYM